MPHGFFLTIEGSEGVGKSTALKFIQKCLTNAQQTFVTTREPGGTLIAEQIRTILLTPNAEEAIVPSAELLLMFACRAQHLENFIKPALAKGKWVVSDRFVDASYAYQGAGRGLDLNQIKVLDQWVVGDLQPNATILLDAPPHIGLARAKNRGAHDRIEQEKIEFFERVRAGYLQRAKEFPKRYHVVNAAQPLTAVQAELKNLLDKMIAEKSSDK